MCGAKGFLPPRKGIRSQRVAAISLSLQKTSSRPVSFREDCAFQPARVTRVTIAAKIFSVRACTPNLVALKWCNPYHRVELCGVTRLRRLPFHKVFNNCVENLTRNKSSLVRFGTVRAKHSLTSFLTTSVFRCYIGV